MAIYSAIQPIADYLVGKDFVPDSYDYRYYYFTVTEQLTEALEDMPYWYRNLFAPPWS